jgi:predicted transcriptional regulator
MPEPTTRDRILQAFEDLPESATFADAIGRLVFMAKIDAGLADLDAGRWARTHDSRRRKENLSDDES